MSRVATISNLTEAIGLEGALTLAAFAGGRTLYVPERYRPDHLLERLLGEETFLRMIAAHGGETVMFVHARMDAERRVGAVYRGMRAGLTTKQIAAEIGISYRRVRQIEVAIRGDGPLTALARGDSKTA